MALPSSPTLDCGPAVLPNPDIGHGPVDLGSAVLNIGGGPAFPFIDLLFHGPGAIIVDHGPAFLSNSGHGSATLAAL